MGAQFQLWRFENVVRPGQEYEGHDRLFIPRAGYTTGDLDVHDLAAEAGGRLVFVNTRFGCLAALSGRDSFTPLWLPAFQSRLVPEDRCHLNGLALDDGRVRYVTAVAMSDMADGWRDRRRDGGVVVDVQRNEVVARGLSMPHSPRVYHGRLWLHNSGTGEFGHVDLAAGRFEPLCFCPGYLRGLAFAGDFAVMGLSLARQEDKTFGGLPLGENLGSRGAEPRCGLLVVDLQSGQTAHWVRIEGMVSELRGDARRRRPPDGLRVQNGRDPEVRDGRRGGSLVTFACSARDHSRPRVRHPLTGRSPRPPCAGTPVRPAASRSARSVVHPARGGRPRSATPRGSGRSPSNVRNQ